MSHPLFNQRILTTFPGRAGDLLWALPTVRAIAEVAQHPVDLQIAGEFASMVDLLSQQDYLSGVWADPRWTLTPPDDWKAPRLPRDYDRIFHLGYHGWPSLPLPREVEALLAEQWTSDLPGLPPRIDLSRPWITVKPWTQLPHDIAVGWSDCHFELKYGLTRLLSENWAHEHTSGFVLAAPGSRWVSEGDMEAVDWLEAARRLASAKVFLGDCSALHVLAVALGILAVVVEPMEARLSSIFWPLGKDGPRVTLVRGNDGQATFDARHTAEYLTKVLEARR